MKSQTEKALRETAPEEADQDFDDDKTPDDPDDSSELDEIDLDDDRWDAFIPDDDERDPQPDYGDFWSED